MAGGGGNYEDEGFTDISITNLIDVLLCLLLTFMITAKGTVHSNVKINLPQVVTKEKAQKTEIIIEVTKDGSVFLANKQLAVGPLRTYLKELQSEKNTHKVTIRADGEANYGRVMEVMDTARISGLNSVALEVKVQQPATASSSSK